MRKLRKHSQASVRTYGSSSTPATKLDDLPWKNILGSSQDSELPIGARLADLKFSSDSSTLMGITDVRQEGSRYQYELFTWDIVTGQRFPSIRPPTTTVRPQLPIELTTSNSSN